MESDSEYVKKAVSDSGGTSGVASDLGLSYNAVKKWELRNRVPGDRVPEFIKRYGDQHKPYLLNPDTHPAWLFERFGGDFRAVDIVKSAA